MKRVPGIICCFLCVLTVYAEPSAITLKMLKDTFVAEGKDYLAQRDAIIKKATAGKTGEEFLEELKDVAMDELLSWQTRLMANICVERVKKGNEINELIEYDWRTHPEYNKVHKGSRAGPMRYFGPVIYQDLKEKKMWFYYLELVWRDTGEYDMSIPKIRYERWRGMSKKALTDSPESYYLIRILEKQISKDPNMGKHHTQCVYSYLIKHSDQTSMHFLLKTLDKSGMHKTGYFMDILPKVKSEDMEYILQYGKTTEMDKDERHEFNKQLSRLNKKFGLTADGKPIPKSTE